MDKIATQIPIVPGGDWSGDVRLYKLTPPYEYDRWNGEHIIAEYVVSSSVSNMFASETMLFPANEDGTAMNMSDLACRGFGEHEECLDDIGYTVAH